MLFRRALVEDHRFDRSTPVASIELTEADLRSVATALSHAAVKAPGMWAGMEQDFESLARRFKRVADQLRHEARNQNGAAPVAPGPRHDSRQETPA